MLRARLFYDGLADQGAPRAFFRDPPRGVEIRRRKARWPYFRPRGGVCELQRHSEGSGCTACASGRPVS